MNLNMKQIVLGLVSIVIFTGIVLGATFVTFPLENWKSLWQGELYRDVPYFVFIVIVVVSVGITGGLSYQWYMQRRIKIISGRLEELLKGQPLSVEEMERFQELQSIQGQILQLEKKFAKQAELSQRLATVRAEEREKSLQDVIVQERNRLARELHDSVSQQLFAASMMMSAINEGNPPKDANMKRQLMMVEKMIDQSQLEMRALLLHLRPIALREKSLQEGMEELLLELRQKVPMEIDWKVESLQLEKGVEDHLFRILQESVSNALRHSKASQLYVMLIERDDNVIMRVTDNGEGFNVEDAKQNSSYGLQNMQERALEISGSLKIVSVEKEGSRLEVKVPYRKKGRETDD